MDFGILFAKKVFRRNAVVKDAMCKSNVSEDDRNALVFNLNIQKYTNVLIRVSIIPIFYLLYKRKYFDKASPFFIREIGLAAACIVGLSFCDYGSNEYMWRNSIDIIKKYGAYNEQFYIDDKSYDKMKGQYKRNKEEFLKKNEIAKKERNEEITKINDKMYD